MFFRDVSTNQLFSRDVKEIFEDKTLLKQFGSRDASLIGFWYTKILMNSKE